MFEYHLLGGVKRSIAYSLKILFVGHMAIGYKTDFVPVDNALAVL